MQKTEEALGRLALIPNLTVSRDVPLSEFTRFRIGGPASVIVQTDIDESFTAAIALVRQIGLPFVVIGGGTNLLVSDAGFTGVVFQYTARGIRADGGSVSVAAGAELQALVDFAIDRGLSGLETITGVPGSVGAAIYGNAGAYGHAISEFVSSVRFFDGASVRVFGRSECEFRYRESIFKQHKEWVILSTRLVLSPAPKEDLRRAADEIRAIRDRKYPPTMLCAGSIFKNLILAELPEMVAARVPAQVVREGKVPSAWFLEQVGAKGMRRGDIQVADYHANLIYNDGQGTASDLCSLIVELKASVRERFGLELQEEIQYVGFPPAEE